MNCLTVRPHRRGFGTDFDRIFDDFFNVPMLRSEHSDLSTGDASFAPRVNVSETDDQVLLAFELPGMEKDDIKVTVAEGVLTVSGERKFSQEKEAKGFVRSEIRSGTFSRSFTLPETVDVNRVGADYKAGLLTVSLAKLEEVKPKQIDIRVQ